jgi:hypothetical protein
MLETAFHDEFSLMAPNTTHRNVQTLDKAVALVNDAVQLRRERNKERDEWLRSARTKSALCTPDLLMARTIQQHRDVQSGADYEAIQRRYVEGIHVHGAIHASEINNIYLESDMYSAAARVIRESEPMSDYEQMHIGEVELPLPTVEQAEALKVQVSKVEELRKRNEIFMNVQNGRALVRQTLLRISQYEDEISKVSAEVQMLKETMGFDWAVERNNYIRSLKRLIGEQKYVVTEGNKKLENEIIEARSLYPDMNFDEFEFS